ncbi:MAG: hypothetical protein AAGA03_10600 [Planctomycetota bacterium]
MNDEALCRSLLRLADAIPSTVTWHVIDLADCRTLLVVDRRDEATTMIMEAIAGRFGSVIAMESIPSSRDAGPLLGCLIRVPGAADEAAERLRGAYAVGTAEGGKEIEGPF